MTVETVDGLGVLDEHLPIEIRDSIETEYYERISDQARVENAVEDERFLAAPFSHVALYSDHGVVHVRDVACRIVDLIDAMTGVLLPSRNRTRVKFMQSYA